MLLTFCVKVFSRCMFLKLYICDFYREHQKMLQRKLMVRVVTEWRGVAERCMQRAVHEFAVRIGLQSPEDFSGEALSTSGDSGKLDSISMYLNWRINFLRFHRYSSSTNCNIQLLMKLSLYSWFINLKWIQKCSAHGPVKIRKSMKTGPNEFNDFKSWKRSYHRSKFHNYDKVREEWYFYTWLHNNDRIWEDFDISTESADRLQLLTDMILASENTSGIHSPVASSTLGTPMKRYQISDLMYVYLQER